MLIIPFRDKSLDYFESPEGRALSEYVGYYMRAQNVAPVLYRQFFPPGVMTTWKEHRDNPQAAWREIAEMMGYELVLVGEIHDISFIGKDKAEVVLSAQLYDMSAGGRLVWSMDRQRVTYPEGWELDEEIPRSRVTLTNGVLNAAGERIGMCFHEHLEFTR